LGLVGLPGRSIGDVGENDGDDGLNCGLDAYRPPASISGEVGEYPAGDDGEYPPYPNGEVGEVENGLVARGLVAYGLTVLEPKPPPYSVPKPLGLSPPPWMGEKLPATGE
jgi:hypothetical protein